MRLDLAAFAELEAFAQLGTDLDPATQQRLDRGYRINELLKQGLCRPMHVTDQVISIYAVTRGYVDKLPVSKVHDFEEKLLAFVHEKHQDFWDGLTANKKMDSETETALQAIIDKFVKQYE